ncbi:hypothetical protein TNCV_3892471 [Trichonephila clavipes]|nr:hypothetical protein TNCV_3892471 [Trichonephila clavipes]
MEQKGISLRASSLALLFVFFVGCNLQKESLHIPFPEKKIVLLLMNFLSDTLRRLFSAIAVIEYIPIKSVETFFRCRLVEMVGQVNACAEAI